ncbi:MAG: type II toxin-antitoxin system RelE/ParE family toxin [Cyclobacteriaceae bacterium]
MGVVWTKKAEQDYYQQIDYLLDRWNPEIAENFIKSVFQTIDYISANPRIYASTDVPQVRKAVVNQHISIFYHLADNKITLLRLWPNRQNPEKLDL